MNEAPSDQPAPKPDRSSWSIARPCSQTRDHVTPAEPGPPTLTSGTEAENMPVRSSIDPDTPSPSRRAPERGPAAAAGAAARTVTNGTRSAATSADVTARTIVLRGRAARRDVRLMWTYLTSRSGSAAARGPRGRP